VALLLTSTQRTKTLLFSEDPEVQFESASAKPAAPVWLDADACLPSPGATRVAVRALSWLQWTECEADKDPGRQMLAVVRAGVQSVDGGDPAAFLADPLPVLVAPLYQAILGLTWGNS
jgi:hypothetical protein